MTAPATKPTRRPYVTDTDMCRVCRHGQNGCPAQHHLGVGKVIACIGYLPAAARI